MKKLGLIILLVSVQLNAISQTTLCDIFRAIFIDGKNGFSTFYGPNNGAIGYSNVDGMIFEGYVLNDSKAVRNDMLNGQTFVEGSINRFNLGEIYEDENLMKFYQWNFRLNGPSVDYSSIPDSIRTNRLIADMESMAKQVQESCFSELAISNSVNTSADKNGNLEIGKITICSKDALNGTFFSLALNPLTPNLTISVNKDPNQENFYYIIYRFYYTVEK